MVVVVVGMHRSGTSALAGLLHAAGICMGNEESFYPPPSPENPKGFFEDVEFRKINDAIAELAGYSIKSWELPIPTFSANRSLRRQMRRLLKLRAKASEHWGWKDPRTCLTLNLWVDALKARRLARSCKLVYIWRDPEAVAQSMHKRGNTTVEQALRVWEECTRRSLLVVDASQLPVHFLRFESLCTQTEAVTGALFDFLELSSAAVPIDEWIDPKLQRNRTSSEIEASCPFTDSPALRELLRRTPIAGGVDAIPGTAACAGETRILHQGRCSSGFADAQTSAGASRFD